MCIIVHVDDVMKEDDENHSMIENLECAGNDHQLHQLDLGLSKLNLWHQKLFALLTILLGTTPHAPQLALEICSKSTLVH